METQSMVQLTWSLRMDMNSSHNCFCFYNQLKIHCIRDLEMGCLWADDKEPKLQGMYSEVPFPNQFRQRLVQKTQVNLSESCRYQHMVVI